MSVLLGQCSTSSINRKVTSQITSECKGRGAKATGAAELAVPASQGTLGNLSKQNGNVTATAVNTMEFKIL